MVSPRSSSTLFPNIIHEQNTSNSNLTDKAYPGYCKHVLCWRPPEKALAYLMTWEIHHNDLNLDINSYNSHRINLGSYLY